MKKAIIGSVVGAIIIFIWQFLSFGMVNFHRPAQDYTDKQDAIMSFLNGQGLKEGGYVMPSVPATASRDEMSAAMKASDGKPWAKIEYHNALANNTNAMIMNMVRGLLVNFVIVLLFCWIVAKMAVPGFGTILGAAVVVGLVAFLNEPYTGFIWYKTFDIWAYFFDAIVSWGLTGLWLAWWLRRGRPTMSTVRIGETEKELA
ncbi:MAG: hypothetical protein ACXVBZ_08380 [Flavisolibacter sp.]